VKGPADTPEKMRRKGSFLRRHFARLRGPLVDDAGEPTRLALSAHAWGEPVPRTAAAACRLAGNGSKPARRRPVPAEKNSLVGNINRRKRAGTSRSKAASSVSKESYEQMQQGWPKAAKKKRQKPSKSAPARKRASRKKR
jgi:Domain of unknown function (DUF6321)